MNKFISRLEKKQEKILARIETMDADNLKKALDASQLLGEGIYQLKEFTRTYIFKDTDSEIDFFKNIKPRLCSHVIYYRKVYNFEMNRPVGDKEVHREYICKELSNLQEYKELRLDFYRYYRDGSTYLDERYFTRFNTDMDMYLDTSFFERDPFFSTNCDDKVAKIFANDQFEVFLKSELERIDTYSPLPGDAIYPKVGIRLEANNIDILEVLLALHCYGSFGDIPKKCVIDFFEVVFNRNFGNYTRTFSEMKSRNDPVAFLNKLIDALLEHMKREDIIEQRRRNKKKRY